MIVAKNIVYWPLVQEYQVYRLHPYKACMDVASYICQISHIQGIMSEYLTIILDRP